MHENPPVETLSLELQQNPALFVDMVSMVFLPRHRDGNNDEKNRPREGSDRERNAQNAMRLLDSWTWTLRSDTDDDGELSAMLGWVTDTIGKLRDAGRLVVGEQMIGRMLGSVTDPNEEMRPAKVVRDLLEEIRRPEIETGVELSLINSRDVTCRKRGMFATSPDLGLYNQLRRDFHIPRENRSGVVGQRTRGNPTGLSDGSAGLIRQTGGPLYGRGCGRI